MEDNRLHIILSTLIEVMPEVTLADALKVAGKVDEKVSQKALTDSEFKKTSGGLVIIHPGDARTAAKWIDTQSDIKEMIALGKKINAIKEVRARCVNSTDGEHFGLRDSKDAVELWADNGHLR